MKLNKYKCIIWDFDGVIINSDAIRELGFVETLNKFPKEEVNLLLNYHRDNGGLSRYIKFRYFYEKILDVEVTEERINELAKFFSEIMLSKLTDKKLLIQDSLKFIIEKHKHIVMFIASGSDNNELNYLCKKLGIAKYFKSINGSPTHKNEIVKTILQDHSNFSKVNFVLIGDSKNDFEAAQANEIDFFGYNNIDLKNICDYYINSFKNEA